MIKYDKYIIKIEQDKNIYFDCPYINLPFLYSDRQVITIILFMIKLYIFKKIYIYILNDKFTKE